MQVEQNRQIRPALLGAQVRDVVDPSAIGGVGLEVAIEHVGSQRLGMCRVRRVVHFRAFTKTAMDFSKAFDRLNFELNWVSFSLHS